MDDRFSEIFAVEIDGWCYGIANYPGEIYPELVHRVIKELRESFRVAIEHGVMFDILDIAGKISKASKYLVGEKEAAYSILAQLPNPARLPEDQMYTMASIIDKVEAVYGGTLEKLQRKWVVERKAAA